MMSQFEMCTDDTTLRVLIVFLLAALVTTKYFFKFKRGKSVCRGIKCSVHISHRKCCKKLRIQVIKLKP